MIREYISGEVVERVCFPVGNATKTRRGKQKGATPVRKQEQNEKAAVRSLARTINVNYKPGDIWVTLTYSEARLAKLVYRIMNDGKEPDMDTIWHYAVSDRDRFLRRVKREFKKSGEELPYVAATADIDGQTGEVVRIHHHLVLPKAAFDFVFKHWSQTEVDYKPLRDQKDYTPIAEYIIKQVRRQPDKKKYTTSRNLKKPEVREKIVRFPKELKAPSGARVMQRGAYDPEIPVQYLRYIKPEKKQKRGGKRE